MGGYRAGLILASPEFDTYGSLRRFAELPDTCGLIGLRCLLLRCERQVIWATVASGERDKTIFEKLISIRLGRASADSEQDQGGSTETQKLASASSEEKLAFYLSALKNGGFEVDQTTLVEHMKNNTGQDKSNKK